MSVRFMLLSFVVFAGVAVACGPAERQGGLVESPRGTSQLVEEARQSQQEDPSVVANTDLGPGVHDFILPSADGEPVQLSSFLGEKNVILVFYRAWW